MKKFRFVLPLIVLATAVGAAQGSLPFQNEVEALQEKYDTVYTASQQTIVFTGSSSIRMWKDVENRFPKQNIINTGFGGSQASDLSYYIYDLVLRFHPKKVFLYEGDNDIFARKSPNSIRNTLEKIIVGIHQQDSNTEVVIIAAKPSILRWNLRRNYKKLNRKLNRLANRTANVQFADVWNPMLKGRKVKQDIFVEDGLHMNAKGYSIWYNVMRPFIDNLRHPDKYL